MYAKVANLILFFRADPRYGLVYLLLFTLQAILLPEPTYKGPEKIIYFRFVQIFYITNKICYESRCLYNDFRVSM